MKRSGLVLACLLAVLVAASSVMPAGASSVASSVTAAGDGTWYWQNPKPFGDELDAVAMIDADRAWAVGYGGILVRTADGGATWRRVGLPVDAVLTDIEFTDANHGWVVGAIPPVIMATSNGGATWRVQWRGAATSQWWWYSVAGRGAVAKARAMLAASRRTRVRNKAAGKAEIGRVARAVAGRDLGARPEMPYTASFRDALHGWVGGELGFLMQTVDGGRTWVRRDTKTALGLYSIQFPSASVGYISTQTDAVLKTVDGGRTWTRTSTGQSSWVNDIAFVDTSHGWAAGYNGVLETTDGASWVPVHVGGGNDYLTAIVAADADHVWAVGERWTGVDEPLILYSPDGGDSWSGVPATGCAALRDIALAPGVVAGAIVGAGASFLHSTDPTVGWTLRGTSATRDDLGDVSMVDTRTGWAAGGGSVVRTLDGGATWTTASATGVTDLQHVEAIDATTAYAASTSVIKRTEDGGASWDSTTAPTSMQDLEFHDQDHGWGLGYYGDILIITNDGLSTDTTTLPWTGWRAISFPSTSTGYIVGYQGLIAKTEDGGHSWARIPVTETAALHSVHFVDEDTGWAGGDYGLVMHTSDGGTTWERQSAESLWSFRSMDFADARNGYALTESPGWRGSTLLYTHNGGRDWMVARGVFPQYMSALDFVTPRRGWAVGSDGAIMATRRQGAVMARPVASPPIVSRRSTVQLSARLTANGRDVERREDVRVWRKPLGSSRWVYDGRAAWDIGTGAYVTRRAANRNTWFQFRFGGDSLYARSNSPARLVRSRAWLGRPACPSVVSDNVRFDISGYLKPAHGGATALDFYRLQGGRWVLRRTLWARNRPAPGGLSRYGRRVEVLLPGRWYVRARHSDTSHVLSVSPKRFFRAR